MFFLSVSNVSATAAQESTSSKPLLAMATRIAEGTRVRSKIWNARDLVIANDRGFAMASQLTIG